MQLIDSLPLIIYLPRLVYISSLSIQADFDQNPGLLSLFFIFLGFSAATFLLYVFSHKIFILKL